MILVVLVHAANLGDRDGAIHLFADHGSTGPCKQWIKDLLGWETGSLPKDGNESHHTWALVDGKPVLRLLPNGGFHIQHNWWNVKRMLSRRSGRALPSGSASLASLLSVPLSLRYDTL